MFKRLLYIFLFLLTSVAAFAQQYPVQGSLAIASPYPANLSDYANSNIQSLALNLTLTDLTMANKRVRLKLFIQTQNATIAQSIDNISGEPLIMLDGGIPQRFTNTELAHYFRLENLQGINPDGYARSLPEGIYTIGFEVYDYFTGNKLSGRISQTFWIIINDPPLLNSPTDKSKIADFTSGSGGSGGIIFNWTPRSSQVTNTEYEFTLSELWDAAGDPYQQFMSAIPKYQTTVSNTTTLIYNQAQPSLISGYTYAWRVRAKAKAGFEDIGLYRNDGYSNLFTFRYGDPCPAPQSLALEAKSSDAIAATWDAPVGATTGGVRYKIAYRKYSAAGQWSWAETETSDLFRTISDLEPATEYEIKVGVPCSQTNEVVYTPSQRATTLVAGQISGVECGKEPTVDLSKQTLLTLLKAGDVLMANDFPTTISSVTGTSQGWSGEAWTKVPWLGDTRIHVTYASIKVNSDYKLIDGSFITTYDPTGKNIGDIDKTIDDAVGLYTGGTDVGKVVTGTAAATYTVPYTITPADTIGSTFTANTTGGGTITLGNGQTLTVSNLPTTVQDAAGTVYQADDKGKLTKVGSNSSNAGAMLATANLTVVDASKGTVTFAPTSDMKYAFDAWQKAYDGNSAWSKRYETLPISGQSGKYRVSSKLMVPGEADKVLAIVNLNNKNLVADSVRFVNAKGTLFEKKKITDNSYELSLVGGPAGDAQEVYALYSTGGKTYTLGKLLVATYEPKTINLALVPVNDATLDSEVIAAELKKVYEPLGIDFNLTTKDKFKYEALETASLKVEGSGLLSVYTEQMKALNAAFVANGKYDKNTIYLFAIDQPESQDGKSIEGVMPRGQQFGYMFVKGKNGDAQGLTAAHEIGHGVFQLQHAFEYSGIKQKTITPLNVMDYPAGEALSKLQWDLMHDPGLVISVFETDKGAEITLGTNEYLGFSPNGDVIDISKLKHQINSFDPKNTNYVYAMSVDGKTNTYKWDSKEKGYKFQNDGSVEYPYLKTVAQDIKVAIWIHQTDSCYAIYKYIPIDKGYVPTSFARIETERINNADYSKGWIIDDANKLNAECKQKAEAAITAMNALDCTPNYKITIPGSVSLWVNSHAELCLKNLGADERWNLIKILSTDLGGGIAKVEGEFDSDDALLRLLAFTSDELQKATLYQKLKTEKANGQLSYLDVIINTMDDEDLVLFSKWMMQCTIAQTLPNAEKTNKDKNIPVYLYKNTDEGTAYQGIKFTLTFERANGKIYITQKRLNLNGDWPATDYYQKRAFAPDELVKLHFYGDLRYGLETIYHSNSDIAIPALALWSIIEQKKERDLTLGIKAVALVLSLPAVTEGGTAAAFAAVDALALGSNIAIEDTGWKNKISTEKGKKCLAGYETFINLYFAGRALEAIGALDGLKASYKEWKATATNADEIALVEGKIGKIVGDESVENTSIQSIDDVIDETQFTILVKDIRYLSGPLLPEKIAATFENSLYTNRQLLTNERYFKYHGIDNRTGRKFSWLTNQKYATENEIRKGLAIRDDWGVKIESVTEFDVPSGTWISEGKAASQGNGYPGGNYQAVITNIPKSWIIKTEQAFK